METITTSEIDPFMCGFTILAVMMARSTLRAGRVFSLLYFPVELASTISASQVLEKALRRAGIARTRRRNADLAGGFSLRHEDRRAVMRFLQIRLANFGFRSGNVLEEGRPGTPAARSEKTSSLSQ